MTGFTIVIPFRKRNRIISFSVKGKNLLNFFQNTKQTFTLALSPDDAILVQSAATIAGSTDSQLRASSIVNKVSQIFTLP